MIITATGPLEDTAVYYLVVCSYPECPAHAWIIMADSAEIAAGVGRFRYSAVTDVAVADDITTRVTPCSELPEIMFGEDDS